MVRKIASTLLTVVLLSTGAWAANIVVSGNITTNTTWTSNNTYLLNGFVYVKAGATLTIEPGTVIYGDKASKGALIIEQGAKIIADGTAAQPIVFTSALPAGQRSYGDWGGLILCGRAPINVPGGTATIEGGVGSIYGGTDPADNSGTLRYVRLEFPGIAFQPNSEINGLTLGGVGSGTIIDYVQVSYSGDDGFEFFGGTVNAKHLISLRTLDDDFDTDFGYSGKVQYAV
ncbi:MAG: T9SS C-terminal target domain-containing protein, partial [bacterium]